MFGFDNGNLIVTMPDLSTIPVQWIVISGLGISFVYGFVTHFVSLPAIHEWNREAKRRGKGDLKGAPYRNERGIGDAGLFGMLMYRLFLNLIVRIVSMAVGSVVAFGVLISSGKFHSNSLLSWGWHWHTTPAQAAEKAN